MAPTESRDAHPFLQLQSTIGNQAALRLLKARADQVEAASDVAGGVIQRKTAPDVGEVRNETRLAQLARDPREAHSAWKKLHTDDKFIVLAMMERRYGAAFADQFRDVAQRGKPEFATTYWQVGAGPTPEQLKAGGWRFLEMEVTGSAAFDVEVWVNPSGKTIYRDVSTYRFGQTERTAELPKSQEPPRKVTETEVSRLRQEWQEISPRLWKALEVFETDIADLEVNPLGKDLANLTGEDLAKLKAHNAIYNAVSDLEDELWKLIKEAQVVDMGLADEMLSERWAVYKEINRILE